LVPVKISESCQAKPSVRIFLTGLQNPAKNFDQKRRVQTKQDQPIGGDQPGKLSPKPATALFTKPSFVILF